MMTGFVVDHPVCTRCMGLRGPATPTDNGPATPKNPGPECKHGPRRFTCYECGGAIYDAMLDDCEVIDQGFVFCPKCVSEWLRHEAGGDGDAQR